MSWIERISNRLTITCGEGSVFSPEWKNAVKLKEYNVSQFEFPEISGTLVKRQLPKGTKYGIEFYFQGLNNIDTSNAFETAADDPRPWVISHPLYDRLVVQPLSLNFDNTKQNVTKITGTVIETISDANPRSSIDPIDKIVNDQIALNEQLSLDYANNVAPDVTDINQMIENNVTLFNEGIGIITENDDFENYFNAFNTANSAILQATSAPLLAIRTLQAVINAPALFIQGVKERFNTLTSQLNKLRQSFTGIADVDGVPQPITSIADVSLKRLFENNSAAVLSAISLALVTDAVYTTRSEVVAVMDEFLNVYNNYISEIDSIQNDNSNSPESYVPSFRSQNQLNDLVNFTVSKLFEISIDSRQERSIILEEDDNVVNLAHRFYGLAQDDSTISELITTNDIGLNEYLGLKKGRKVVYFV